LNTQIDKNANRDTRQAGFEPATVGLEIDAEIDGLADSYLSIGADDWGDDLDALGDDLDGLIGDLDDWEDV
jgi:hypothetical protein